MLLPEQDTEMCYGESNKEKKNGAYRHLSEGENAAPLRTLDAPGPCERRFNEHEGGERALKKLKEKGATE